MDEELTSVSIPRSLFKTLEDKIKGTNFSSVSSYVVFLLREHVSETAKQDEQSLSSEEEEKVKERLRALGYI
ncbi:MAG: CopG family transcriptional regulator [Candidatus Bathyarchaeia archaeon]